MTSPDGTWHRAPVSNWIAAALEGGELFLFFLFSQLSL
jgi:hypothetical protein